MVTPAASDRRLTADGLRLRAWLEDSAADLGRGPLVVHADVLRAGRPFVSFVGRDAWQREHLRILAGVAGERPLWMPTFCYGFTRHGTFDPDTEASEVGVLTERFRVEQAAWRSAVPVFSFAGTGPRPAVDESGLIDPFDDRSAFAAMVRDDAVLLCYGAPFDSMTIKHHVERRTGGPAYRYDKDFPGHVRFASGSSRTVVLRYHVRPLDRRVSYDDDRIERELEADVGAAGWRRFDGAARQIAVSARRAVHAWSERLADDPLYFLDAPSRSWIEPELQRLGRRFHRMDFEGPQAIVPTERRPGTR